MWLLTTYNRPERLVKQLASLRACHVSTPGVVLINDAREKYPSDAELGLPDGWTVHCYGENLRLIPALKEGIKLFPNEPWYGFLTDDQIAETDRFDRTMLDALQPHQMLCTNDGYQAPYRTHGACMWDGPLFRYIMLEKMCDSKHSYIDDTWETLGFVLGFLQFDMALMVRHMHCQNPTAQQMMDDTYKEAYATAPADKEAFNAWLADFPQILKEVGAFIGMKPETIPEVDGQAIHQALAWNRVIKMHERFNVPLSPELQAQLAALKTA